MQRMLFDGASELVTLAEFSSQQEFLLARGLLESEGIDCFCPDYYSALYVEARAKRYTLQVRSEDLPAARALLDAPPEPLSET